jgi:hypothetical protein
MRKGAFLLAPIAFLTASVIIACGADRARPSGFIVEQDPTEEAGGGPPFASSNLGKADGGCGASQAEIKRIPVVLEFLVDESTSMNADNKWTSARDALLAAFEEMNSLQDPATFVGLYLYPRAAKVSPKSLVDSDQYGDLEQLIDIATPTGGSAGTPTGPALEAAYGIVERFIPPKNSGLTAEKMKRVVVLLSDGVPTGGDPAKVACENLVEERFEKAPDDNGPVLTFSIGIGPFPNGGSSYDPKFMSHLAQKGGTAPDGCDPDSTDPSQVCHFQITPGVDAEATKQALIDALKRIRELTASCEFDFKANKDSDLTKIKVVITDKDGNRSKIPRDPEDGWEFDDPNHPTKVILHGDSCAASGGTIAGRIDVVAGCTTAK